MSSSPARQTAAYRHGWDDGRYGERRRFTDNPRLTGLQSASDRLDYYRGHRAGREARLREVDPLEAS